MQKELSNIIRNEIKDPRIHPMTSVVAAEVAPDLKFCKAYISVLGDEEAQKSTINWLRALICAIRRRSPLCWISPLSMACICQS